MHIQYASVNWNKIKGTKKNISIKEKVVHSHKEYVNYAVRNYKNIKKVKKVSRGNGEYSYIISLLN